jgi:DNA repair protein RadC
MKTFKSKLREVTAVYKTTCSLQNVKITNSKDVNELIRKIYPVEINIREAMVVLYLNNSNRTLGYGVIGIGGFTATHVDIRLILRDAFLTQSTSIILIHNHPSGSLTPSEADMNITDKIKKAAGIMDIRLLDHLILTENSYYSFIEHAKL